MQWNPDRPLTTAHCDTGHCLTGRVGHPSPLSLLTGFNLFSLLLLASHKKVPVGPPTTSAFFSAGAYCPASQTPGR